MSYYFEAYFDRIIKMSRSFRIFIIILLVIYLITSCNCKKKKSKKCGIKYVAIERIKFQKVPVIYPETPEQPKDEQYLLHHHQQYQQKMKNQPNGN